MYYDKYSNKIKWKRTFCLFDFISLFQLSFCVVFYRKWCESQFHLCVKNGQSLKQKIFVAIHVFRAINDKTNFEAKGPMFHRRYARKNPPKRVPLDAFYMNTE